MFFVHAKHLVVSTVNRSKSHNAFINQEASVPQDASIHQAASVVYLDEFGLDLPVRGHLLVGQDVAVTLGQDLLAGGRHLDGVGDAGLQHCAQVHAGDRLVVHPLLSTGGA